MKDRLSTVIVKPTSGDIPLVERLLDTDRISVSAVITDERSDSTAWFADRGIERYDRISDYPRAVPGLLVVYLGEGLPPPELMRTVTSERLMIVGRDELSLFYAEKEPHEVDVSARSTQVMTHFRKLLDDYFPTSSHSTTSVKLTSSLTEATAAFGADGGLIFTSAAGGSTLSLLGQRGSELPRDLKLPLDSGTPLGRAFTFNKSRVMGDLSSGSVVPGIAAASVALVPISNGVSTLGVFLLWSEKSDYFEETDLSGISLYAYYVAMLLEVDELGEKLEENLMTDPLTGVYNRKQFNLRLHHEIERAKRYTLYVSLVIYDIDQLEEYNKACGRMMGNLALSDIASMLEKGTREVDFVARIGGDEFALILPETSRLGAVRLAERLRQEVASYPFPVPEDRTAVNITVTGGIATYPSNADNERDLVAKAFKALEQAKEEDGDIIKLWSDDEEDSQGDQR